MVNGWVERPITEVLKPNGIKIGPFGSQLKKEMLLSDGVYRVYGQENVYARDFNIGDRYLTREHFNRLNSCEILPGDFVMSTMGTIGKCAIVPTTIQRGIMDSHLIRLRFNEKKVRSDYILQLFSDQFHYLSDQTARLAVGGIMDGLSVGIVSRLNVIYPESIEEQGKIIKTLSEVDKLIFDQQKLIRKKKDIRQGTMQMLVTGKKRLGNFSGEWFDCTLAAIAYVLNGDRGINYPSGDDFIEYGIPFINAGNISNNIVDVSTVDYISIEKYNSLGGVKIQENDIIFCLRGSLGKCAISNFTGGAPASSLCVIRAKDDIDARFLFHIINSEITSRQIDNLNAGSSQPNLSAKSLKSFKFSVPKDVAEQEMISNILSDMDLDIYKLEEKLSKYQKVKQGMMEELLTGKVRLV